MSNGQQPAAQADNGGTCDCEHEWEYCSEYDAADGTVQHYIECRVCKEVKHGVFEGLVHGYQFKNVRFPSHDYVDKYIVPGWVSKA